MKFLLLAAPAIALLPSCSWLVTPPKAEPHQPFTWKNSGAESPLLVFSHGHHTGLSLPAESLREHLPHLCQGLTDQWLEFGWGDEGFYRSEKITAPLVFSALCYPTPGVVHVVVQEPPIHQHYRYSPVRILSLNREERNHLGTFLADTFKKDEDDNLINLGPDVMARAPSTALTRATTFLVVATLGPRKDSKRVVLTSTPTPSPPRVS